MRESIGKYKVLGELGRGAMGIVYKAEDPYIGRIVAIKTIRFDVLDHQAAQDEAQKRFMREARSAGNLSHPNIVTIYEVGEDQGLTYIAMEHIDGCSLEKMIDSGKMFTVEEAISQIEQIADALDYAHRKGIIHRDIKPANILVDNEGRPHIVDFGIARITSSTMTQTSMVMGTPFYMSPEQTSGRRIDSRSDIFSLGAVLYEILTLQKPFPGDNITTVIYKIVNEDPPPARTFNAKLPDGLDPVIRKALAKDPGSRYPTCADLARDLMNYPQFAGIAATAPVPTEATAPAPAAVSTAVEYEAEMPVEEKVRERSRKPLLLVLGSMMAVVVVVLVAVYLTTRESGRTSIPGGGGGLAVPVPTVQSYLQAGMDAGAKGDLQGAVDQYNKALSLDPGNVEARLLLADVFRSQRRLDEALALLEGLVGQPDAGSELLVKLAEILEDKGETDRALTYYRSYASAQPSGAEAERVRRKIQILEPIAATGGQTAATETTPDKPPLDIAGDSGPVTPPPEKKSTVTPTSPQEKKPEAKTGGQVEPKPPPEKGSGDVEPAIDVTAILSDGISAFNGGEYEQAAAKMRQVLELDPGNPSATRYLNVAQARIQEKQKQDQIQGLLRRARADLQRQDFSNGIAKARQVLGMEPQNEEALSILDQALEKEALAQILVVFSSYKQVFGTARLDDFYRNACLPALYQKLKQQAAMYANLYKNYNNSFNQPEIANLSKEGGQYVSAVVRFIQVSQATSTQGQQGELVNGAYMWALRKIGGGWKITDITFNPRK